MATKKKSTSTKSSEDEQNTHTEEENEGYAQTTKDSENERDMHTSEQLGDGDTRVVEDENTKDSEPVKDPEPEPEVIQAIDHYIAPIDEDITYLPYQPLKNGMAQNYKQVAGMSDVQEALKEDGFYKGPINGHATKETVEAFARFQDSLGHFPNGVPSIADLEALGFGVVT